MGSVYKMSRHIFFVLVLIMMVTTCTNSSTATKTRIKRGAILNFFQKIVGSASLAYDQYVDTKNTLIEVNDIVADGFSDTSTKRPTTTTTSEPSDDDSTSTTTEKYRISRYEFGRLLGRNFRGLQRVFRLELNEALNASQYNIQEYKDEAAKLYGNSIIGNKKKNSGRIIITKDKNDIRK